MTMIFQDPFAALNPVFTIAHQFDEVLAARQARHLDAEARAAACGARRRRDRGSRPRARLLSVPALRRHEPARHDRHGAGQRAGAAARRRAGHGARRHRAGADAGADARAHREARHGGAADHAQSRRRARIRRARLCHVRGPIVEEGRPRRCSPRRAIPTRGRCSRRCRASPAAAFPDRIEGRRPDYAIRRRCRFHPRARGEAACCDVAVEQEPLRLLEGSATMPETRPSRPSACARYRSSRARQALSRLDLRRRGECLAIVGESGSGKSTLGNIVLGIDPPTAGTFRFDASAAGAARAGARRAIQLVQQNPLSTLNPRRTVGARWLPLDVHGIGGERARGTRRRAPDEVGLPADSARARRRPFGRPAPARGARPRAGLPARADRARRADLGARRARAGACARPADELQAALGLTYIFITHDLAVVRNVAQRVVVLYRGGCRAAATAAVSPPRQRYTRELIGAIPVVTDEEAELRGRLMEKSNASA